MVVVKNFIKHWKAYDVLYPPPKTFDTTSNPTTTLNQQNSPLLRLPSSIRSQIFAYIIDVPGYIEPETDTSGKLSLPTKLKEVMRTGQTCRQVRAETYLRYMAEQTFYFERRHFQQHLALFNGEQLALIRNVRLYGEDTEAYFFWDIVWYLRSIENFVVILDGEEDWGAVVRELRRGLKGLGLAREVQVQAMRLDHVWHTGVLV
jgi:hypothetical protein